MTADALTLPGFRLHRVEVYNWGTFHQKVWHLDVTGENALLTGDIGSGKSTLVDALTTLLVPAHRVAYNKAAGADARERNLRSYVLGHYKSERGGDGPGARPVALRDGTSYSVILAVFHDAVQDHALTLAQVFWCRDVDGPPSRLFLVADGRLTIREDFTGFGADFADLRKRLRKRPGCELYDTFPPYGAALCRHLGTSPQALELFHQTVSMKAVGNLTEFVRTHMLEAANIEVRITALVDHFADLTRAHQAVVDAQMQIDALVPLTVQCTRHATLVTEQADLTVCREALEPWFGAQKEALYRERITRLADEERKSTGRIDGLTRQRDERDQEVAQLISAIATNGGDRIAQLESTRELRQQELASRQRIAKRLKDCCKVVGLAAPTDDSAYLRLREQAVTLQAALSTKQAGLQNQYNDRFFQWRSDKDKHQERASELASLRQRTSNLDDRLVRLRSAICQALEIADDEIPFAGEVLQVRKDEFAWQGAIERVLRGLGQSLLVPDARYAAVAAWVDANNLRGRLVYYQVRLDQAARLGHTGPRSLVRKIEVQPATWAYDWLTRKLHQDHDYACCDTIDDFRREPKALTRNGQIKGGGGRHEKDDGRRIDDPTQYVLGWSNADKIAALEAEQQVLEARIAKDTCILAGFDEQKRDLGHEGDALRDLLSIEKFADLDVAASSAELERLDAEIHLIRSASDVLTKLTERKTACEEERKDLQKQLDLASQSFFANEGRQNDAKRGLAQAIESSNAIGETERAVIFPRLETFRSEQPAQREFTIESAANCETDWRRWLQARIDAISKQLDRLREGIATAMTQFRAAWPVLTQEVDVGVAAAKGYQEILDRLQRDDLPSFAATFQRALKENTIREIANFQAQLQREQHDIQERIDAINRSLGGIDYNPGRYIALVSAQTSHAEVIAFRRDLRACIENTLGTGEDESYSEAKYQQVAVIIERLRGRPDLTEADRRWRELVTDVRNWFEFSASERWREGDTEHEHYADSGGKSGGQKEKLAYTVLAASLAYQYGLGEADRLRCFRLVVIDEAFGRGSDESARFGLELFAKLQLQLLIATPLQKIHVIEPFVAHVGFVANRDGRDSMIRNLSIAEYRAEAAARAGG